MGYLSAGIRDTCPLPFRAGTFSITPITGVVAYVAGLNNDGVFTMIGMGTVAVSGDNAANPTMVEGKCAEMLGEHDNGPALIFV